MGTGRDGAAREACEQMGILWVRGNFDENGQRHEEQPGLVSKKVQGGEPGSEAGGRAGRWICKTEEWGRRGGTQETDGWMEESERFTDGRRQDASADVHVKAMCADEPSVLTRPCPQQTPLMASLVEWFNWLHASLLCPGPPPTPRVHPPHLVPFVSNSLSAFSPRWESPAWRRRRRRRVCTSLWTN